MRRFTMVGAPEGRKVERRVVEIGDLRHLPSVELKGIYQSPGRSQLHPSLNRGGQRGQERTI